MKPAFLPFSHLREDPSGVIIKEDYPMSKEELLSQVTKSVRVGAPGFWGWREGLLNLLGS